MGNTLVVTAMNTDAAQPLDMEIVRREAEARAANTSTLAHPDIHAHNLPCRNIDLFRIRIV